MLTRLRRAVTNWPAEPPSVEVLTLRRERETYRLLAETAIEALELFMDVMDTKTGAARELQLATEHMRAIAANAASDLAELAPALEAYVTACASMAAVQAATSITAYDKRLVEVEEWVRRLREDIADIRTIIRDIQELIK
jgi:hypothetical protein